MVKGIRLPVVAMTVAGTLCLAVGVRAQGARLTPTVTPSVPPATCTPNTVRSPGNGWPLVKAYNGFGFRLLSRLFGPGKTSNVFISPLSAALDLGMAYQGARGGTEKGMIRALGLEGMGQGAVAQYAGHLVTGLRSFDPRVQSEITNSIWMKQGIPFQRSFLSIVRTHYGAQLGTLPFGSPSAAQTINAWVSCGTHGKIKEIVDRTFPSDRMYLINTVYFHGLWSAPFFNRDTYMQPFTNASGVQKKVHMMHQFPGYYPYYQGPDFQAISLPYGKGRFTMNIVLPKRGLALGTFAKNVTPATWQSWMSHLRGSSVTLSFPRFKVLNTFHLQQPLTSMGMGPAFSPGANFSGICLAQCSISDVIQKTYLSVYEKGTTAAAVTATLFTGGGAGPPPPVMTIDHPFLVAITDHHTGAILFLGAITNPQ